MTSMLCVQEPGGFVEHNHKGIAGQLLRDSTNHAIFTKYFPGDKTRQRFHTRRPFSTPAPHIQADNLDRQSLMGHSMQLQSWLNNKSVKLIQEKSGLEAKPVKEMYGAVLNQEETFVKGLQDMCTEHDYLNQRKKEILHKKWADRVYEPLRQAIVDQMDGETYEKFKFRKDQLYREYIEHCNKKGHVFRDDFDPEEYYPMGLHANRPTIATGERRSTCSKTPSPKSSHTKLPGLQAETKKLRDPTLLQQENRDAEDQTMLRCTSGHIYKQRSLEQVRLPTLPLAPQGRHGTENETWTAMPLTDIESPIRQQSRRRMVGTNLRSVINFGNWSVNEYGKETVDEEMGIQKRKMCKRPPFETPRAIGTRKTLPAAKENHRSRTIPCPSMDYDESYQPEPRKYVPFKPFITDGYDPTEDFDDLTPGISRTVAPKISQSAKAHNRSCKQALEIDNVKPLMASYGDVVV